MYHALLSPVLALMVLTFLVWCCMYYLRLSYVMKNRIHPNKLETPEQCNQLLPEHVNKPSNNFKNLCEAPILFYALSIIAVYSNVADNTLVYLAWSFVGVRAIHSAFHCFSSSVLVRFYAYVISSVLLWVMLAKVCLSIWL